MKAICQYALSVVFILHVFIFPHPQDSLTRYTQFYVEDYFLWTLWKNIIPYHFLAVDFEFLVFGSVGSQQCEYFSYLLLYIPNISISKDSRLSSCLENIHALYAQKLLLSSLYPIFLCPWFDNIKIFLSHNKMTTG